MAEGALPRRSPCGSCPYLLDVPAGVWDASEYDRLPAYDGDMSDQVEARALAPFFCHQADGHVCSGWLGVGDPVDLLAVRVGIASKILDPSCVDYATTVRLHPSHTAAADFGRAGVSEPSSEALTVVDRVLRKRAARRGR